jgi:meiotic recombination protein SPO11
VRPSDLDKFNIPEQCRLEMSAKDIETGHHMLKEEFIQQNPDWVAAGLDRMFLRNFP